jgi:hypothetical protein
MFKGPCDLAQYLENLSSEVLSLERSSNVWKVRETSITDVIIANFRMSSWAGSIDVDASKEATTNADFEIVFRSKGCDLTLLLQAKRTSETKSKTPNIPELFHQNSTGCQNKLLID